MRNFPEPIAGHTHQGSSLKIRSLQSLAVLIVMLMLTGCGYQQQGSAEQDPKSSYQWHSLYREDIQTVAVPVFLNVSYRRGLELSLSKAIIQNIELHTPYKVVSSQKADTILEGEIVAANVSTLSNDINSALPQEQMMDIRVNFTWKNLRTGQIMVERRSFEQKASYFPTLGESVAGGSQDAVERLALGIVQELQADW